MWCYLKIQNMYQRKTFIFVSSWTSYKAIWGNRLFINEFSLIFKKKNAVSFFPGFMFLVKCFITAILQIHYGNPRVTAHHRAVKIDMWCSIPLAWQIDMLTEFHLFPVTMVTTVIMKMNLSWILFLKIHNSKPAVTLLNDIKFLRHRRGT